MRKIALYAMHAKIKIFFKTQFNSLPFRHVAEVCGAAVN